MNPLFASAHALETFFQARGWRFCCCWTGDWLDIEGIVLRQGAALNHPQILAEVTPLLALKDDEVSGPRLTRVLETWRDP